VEEVPALPNLGDALPLVPTDERWISVALADLDAVHADHLHCERKARSRRCR
jgi:tRNA isopentenyl-2-thiomethyl-A-37 hydroxylase MiaE